MEKKFELKDPIDIVTEPRVLEALLKYKEDVRSSPLGYVHSACELIKTILENSLK
jgi:hypothetical protein